MSRLRIVQFAVTVRSVVFGLATYIGVGALLHELCIGTAFDWVSWTSWMAMFGWPIAAALAAAIGSVLFGSLFMMGLFTYVLLDYLLTRSQSFSAAGSRG